MTLYNLRSADGDWRITKFTNDLEPESSYLVSTDACECPAGVRPSCRHRQMLPKMLAAGAEDSGMFYDFDKDQFLAPAFEAEPEPELPSTSSDDVEPQRGLPATFNEAEIQQEDEFVRAPRSHPTGVTIRRRF